MDLSICIISLECK